MPDVHRGPTPSAGKVSGPRFAARGARALAALTLGLLAGCAGSRVDDGPVILGDAWRGVRAPEPAAQPEPAPAPQEPSPWTLDAVLARIAAANPTIGVARARLEEAEAARREARAAYWPELSLGLEYLNTDNPAQAFAVLLNQRALTLGPGFDADPGATDNWRKEVRLDWPLLAPGRDAQHQAAREGEEVARLMGESAHNRLLNAGVQGWLGLGAARELELVARESIAVVEQRLAQTARRHAEGAALRADVLRLEVRLAGARQGAARAALTVREAESALNRLMGRAPDAPLELADEAFEVGPALPGTLDALLEAARAERRDLQATVHRVRLAGFERERSRAGNYPRLQLFAAYDIDGPDLSIDEDLDSYTVGVGLRLPLSARTEAGVRRAGAQERAAREELRELSLAIAQEVHDAWEALATARETLALSETAVGAAEEAFRIVAEAQDAGAATVTDVLEAEDARRGARVRDVAARAALQIARARLVAATGGIR